MKNQKLQNNESAMVQNRKSKNCLSHNNDSILSFSLNWLPMKKIITIRSSKKGNYASVLVLAIFFAGIGSVWGQTEKLNIRRSEVSASSSKAVPNTRVSVNNISENEKVLWSKEPYGNRDISKEVIDKRDAYSKHFANEDGSFSAHIASGPIHYQENGQWKTIFHSIEPAPNGGFQNIHNNFKTFYPSTANGSIETRLPNGQVLRDMKDMRMYFEANGQEVGSITIANTAGNADFNVLTYPSVYGNDIDLRLTQNTAIRKMDYILKNVNSLSGAPQDAQYLVFEEKVILPVGVVARLEGNLINLYLNEKLLAQYEKPYINEGSFERTNDNNLKENRNQLLYQNTEETELLLDGRHEGVYEVNQSGNELLIKIKVEMAWLQDENRVYPIEVDPTIGIAQINTLSAGIYAAVINNANSTNFTGLQACNNAFVGYNLNSVDFAVGRRGDVGSGASLRSAFNLAQTRFSLASIPDNSTISAGSLYYHLNSYVGTNNGNISVRKFTTNVTGTANNATTCNQVFSGFTATEYFSNSTYTAGWKNGAVVGSDIQGQLVADWFATGYYPNGNYLGTNRLFIIANWNSINRPYLTITYTEPNCGTNSTTTILTNDATGISNVTFNTINNSTTTNNTYVNTGISTTLCKGNQYVLSVNVNTAGNWTVRARAWIDWDNDGVFSNTTESYDLGTAINTTNGLTSAPATITVPLTAATATVKMRIVAAEQSNYPHACANNFYGEGEDYLLVVTPYGIDGSISATTPTAVCLGQPITVSAAGGTGSPRYWVQSPAGSGTWNIFENQASNSTSNGFTFTPSTPGTYRVHARWQTTCGFCWDQPGHNWTTNNNCTSFAFVDFTVSPTSVAGTASVNQTICSGQIPSALTLTGNTGSIQWQSSTDNNTFSNIGSAISSTLTLSALSSTTYYRAVVTSGACSSVNSNVVTITVNQPSVAPTSITGITTICNGSSTTLTAAGGTLGTGANYEWGTGSVVGTNPMAGQTGASITVTPSSTTTYWVRIINSSAPCATTTTGVSTAVTVNQPSVAPTSITGTTTICNGTSTTLTAAGGTLGTNAVYEWGTGSTVGSNPIAGQSGGSISVSPSLTTTYWVRIINGAAPCSATTSGVSTLVTVNQPSVAPTALNASSTTICNGGSTTLTQSGGTLGTGAVWQWYSDANFTTTVGGTLSSSNASLSVSPTSNTTYYLRAINGTAPCSANIPASTPSAVSVTVTVNPTSVGGTADANQTICSGDTPTTLNLTGNTGNIQWQSSADNNTFSAIGSATGSTLTLGSLTATTYYRAVVTSGVCSSVNSNVVTVTVNQPSVNPTSISGNSLCLGASTTLTAVGGTLGQGANYQWGTGSVVGTNPISGATSSTLSVSPSSLTNYWVQIVNGIGPCSATTAGLSTVVTVNTPTISSTPTAGSVVWRGATSSDWATASNWYSYNGTYSVATNPPSSSTNVIIPAIQSCVAQQPAVALSGTVDANNVTIETGAALTMGNSSVLNVAGNFTINGTGTFTPGTGTVNFTGNGTQVVTTGTQAFNNVTISGFGTVQLTGNTTINGNFTNQSGSLQLNNFNVTIGGNFSNSVSTTFSGDAGLISGTGSIIFNSSNLQTLFTEPIDFNTIQHTGTGTLRLISDISLTGDLINSAGTLDGNDEVITVRNNFTNTATFTSGTQGLGEIYFEKVGVSQTQTLTPGTSVFHKFAHTGSGTLNLTGTVDVKGDVIIDAPISAGTSTLKLTGTVNQTISGSQSVIALNNLMVQNTGGTVNVLKPVNVSGTLTMSQGNINNSSSLITIGTSSSNPGSINYNATTSPRITGALRRYFPSTPGASAYFPVGNSSNTRGATIDFTSDPGTNQYLTVKYQGGAQMGVSPLYTGLPLTTNDGVLIQNYENEGFWEINPTADNYSSSINGTPYTITLQMKNLTTVNDRSTVRIIKAAGNNNPALHHSTWTALTFGANPISGNLNTDFTVTGTTTGFSWFGAGSGNGNPLPVELTSFNGACDNGIINLTWQTASEFNSSHFDVEKSRDGENWQLLTTVPSAGTSNELITYQAADENATDGNNYFRLRQVDIDGTEKLYDPINVSCAEVTTGYFSSYPNPSGTSFQVIVNNKELLGNCIMNIVDAAGKVIEQRQIEVKDGINMFVINQELTPGIYFLNVTNGTKSTPVLRHAIK